MKSDAYVDGFLIAVPTANKEAFRRLADTTAKIFREHGARGQAHLDADGRQAQGR